MKINITGGWVDLREPEEVPERLRRPIVNVTMSGIPLESEMETIMNDPSSADPEKLADFMKFTTEFGDLVALAFIKEWSFPNAVSRESIMDLPGKVFDEIQAAISPLVAGLLPSFNATKDSVLDPKAPTDNLIA